mgnify:CR=1 FL=1
MKISLTSIKIILFFTIGTTLGIEIANLNDITPLKTLTSISYSLRDSIRDPESSSPKYPVYIHHKKQNKDNYLIKVSSSNSPFKQGTLLSEGKYHVIVTGKQSKSVYLRDTITVGSTQNYFEITQGGIHNVL